MLYQLNVVEYKRERKIHVIIHYMMLLIKQLMGMRLLNIIYLIDHLQMNLIRDII